MSHTRIEMEAMQAQINTARHLGDISRALVHLSKDLNKVIETMLNSVETEVAETLDGQSKVIRLKPQVTNSHEPGCTGCSC